MKPPSVSTACHLLPEMVDDAMGQLANQEGDARSVEGEARRMAELLRGQDSTRQLPNALEPAWPLEPGSLTEAVYWYRRTTGLGDAPGPEDVAASLSNLGRAWRGQRRLPEAETAFRESLQLRQRHADRAGVGQTFSDLGSLYLAQERWTDAELALTQCLTIAREIGDRRSEANALGDLAVAYTAVGQSERAMRHLQEAVAVANEIADEAMAERMRERMARLAIDQSL